MADRSAFQVYVLECPPERVRVVLELLTEYGGGPAPHTAGLPQGFDPESMLLLGAEYLSIEEPLGAADLFAETMAAAAPDVTYVAWQDPKYEHLGELHAHVPGVGTIRGDCDPSGNLMWNAPTLLELLGEARVLTSEVEERMGLHVMGRIDELCDRLAADPQTVHAPDAAAEASI